MTSKPLAFDGVRADVAVPDVHINQLFYSPYGFLSVKIGSSTRTRRLGPARWAEGLGARLHWFLVANEQITRAKNHVNKTMTMEQLLEAEQRAAEWMRKIGKIPPSSATREKDATTA
jgi:hypothetical protein